MKKMKLIICVFLFFMTIVDIQGINLKVEELVQMQVMNMVGKEIEFENVYPLFDIDNCYSYDLYELAEEGYVIATHENGFISELMLSSENPYLEVLDLELYYLGPYNYFFKENDHLKEIQSHATISLSDIQSSSLDSKGINDFSYIRLANTDMLNQKVDISIPFAYNVWYGSPESRFLRYNTSSWINKDDTCGPHSSAILMAYLDDYLDDSIVASSIRSRNSSSPEKLISTLVDKTPSPHATYPTTVSQEMHFVLGNKTSYTEGYQTIGSTWTPACSKIDKMGVVCIGLVGALQNNYGDHWVTAY